MNYNIVVSGIGGQGVLTLANVIAEAALKNGYDVKWSELHGLAMRFGHLECHVRFGKKIYSSVIEEGDANLVIALERLEALRSLYYVNKKTSIIFDAKAAVPVHLHLDNIRYPSVEETKKKLKKFAKDIVCINSKNVKELQGRRIFSNIYLLGYAFAKAKLPIKKENIIYGIKQVVPKESFEINKEIFEKAFSKNLR